MADQIEQLPSRKRNTQKNLNQMPQTHGALVLEPMQEGIPQLPAQHSLALLCLMRSLLHEWGNVLPGSQLKSLPRLLEHGCSQNAVADFASSLLITLHGCIQRKAHHVSSPVHIIEQQQNRGTQQSLMPAEPTAMGHPLSHGKRKSGIPRSQNSE